MQAGQQPRILSARCRMELPRVCNLHMGCTRLNPVWTAFLLVRCLFRSGVCVGAALVAARVSARQRAMHSQPALGICQAAHLCGLYIQQHRG